MTATERNRKMPVRRARKIKHKLTIAFLSIITVLMILTLIANQAGLRNSIYMDYKNKGIEDAELTFDLSFRRLLEVSGNYVEFLSKDSNINRAAYYLLVLDARQDIQVTLPEYAKRLGLSFLEVADLEGRIKYSTAVSHGEVRGDETKLPLSLMDAVAGHHISDISYNAILNKFVIHSAMLIERQGEAIGVLHGGYVLDESLLSSLTVDHFLAMYYVDASLVSSSASHLAAPDQAFIKKAFQVALNDCASVESGARCQSQHHETSIQVIDGIPYLYTAMPIMMTSSSPIGTVVIGHDVSVMQRELDKGLIRNMVIFTGMGVLGLLLSLYISRRIATPMESLARLMQAYGDGVMPNFATISHDTHEINNLINSFQQMTHARELSEIAREKSELQLGLLLDSTSEAIIGVDIDGNSTFANQACAEKLGLHDVNELIGRNAFEMICGCTVEEMLSKKHPVMMAHTNGYAYKSENEIINRLDNGLAFPVECNIAPICQDGEHLGSVLTFTDITERKAVQRRSQQLNEELEDKVEQRTHELKLANNELTESLHKLQETQRQLVESEKMASLGGLVAGIAHEINTPIGVGVTAASHLEASVGRYINRYKEGQLTRSDFEKFLNVAEESSHMILSNLLRAGELVRSFKMVAVDQSSDDKRIFFVKSYLDEVLLSLQPHIKKTQIKVSINAPDDLQILSHPGSFSQIITNLIMNSLIHAFDDKQQGAVSIDLSLQPGFILLIYRDNGRGMSEDLINKIFDPFFTTKRGQGGTGLGMHVVYNLVTQSLNGRIRCSSTLGQGCEFTIELPIEDSEIVRKRIA